MLDIISQSKNTVSAYSDAMRILSANMQNYQTDGYKVVQYSFQTVFASEMQKFGGQSDSMALSQSMSLIPEGIDFSQGALSQGRSLNAAISGESLFMVQGLREGEYLYKRTSDFSLNNEGYLMDSMGRKILGYQIAANGEVDKSRLQPIKIDYNKVNFNDVGFEAEGVLVTNYNARKIALANSENVLPQGQKLFQLALGNFTNPKGLSLAAGNAYIATKSSGKLTRIGVSGDDGFGRVLGGFKEASNVDIAGMSIEGVQLQRGYNAVQSAMSMISKVFQDFIRNISQ